MTAAAERDAIEHLPPRRREVLELVAKGFTNDAIAGALTISSSTVRAHLMALFSDLGVTNRTGAAAAYLSWQARPAQIGRVLARPAIAVLPLTPLGGDARTASIAAGITYDLTALLSRWCFFPVIALAAAREKRGIGESATQLGERLGAAYLLEGALQRRGKGWRLTVRIDEAATGESIWADRYDFGDTELLTLLDELSERIVASAYAVLLARFHVRPPRQERALTPWELAQEGLVLQLAREAGANALAQARFDAALELEPCLVLAHFGLGLARYDAVLHQWGEVEKAASGLVAAAERCIDLAPHSAEGHYLLGRHLQVKGLHAQACASLERAVGCNPSFGAAHALLAQTLVLCGRLDEGLTRMQHAQRLGPGAYVAGLAVLHFVRGEYSEALQQSERALHRAPLYAFCYALAAASAWYLQDRPKAREHAQALQRLQPAFTAATFRSTFGAATDGVDRLARALESLATS